MNLQEKIFSKQLVPAELEAPCAGIWFDSEACICKRLSGARLFNMCILIWYDKTKEVHAEERKKDTEVEAMRQQQTAASKNLQGSESVRFSGVKNGGKRLLFVGNSIAWHAPADSIGWTGDWGMAASCPEKDYVHQVAEMVCGVSAPPAVCICQAAAWERAYKTGSEKYPLYESAREFAADVIVVHLIENCPVEGFDAAEYKAALGGLLAYLNQSGKAEIILTTGFWPHVGNPAILEYAAENALPCVILGDLGQQPEMRADGLFEHAGVAAHPGDRGMQAIAERIFAQLKQSL